MHLEQGEQTYSDTGIHNHFYRGLGREPDQGPSTLASADIDVMAPDFLSLLVPVGAKGEWAGVGQGKLGDLPLSLMLELLYIPFSYP